MPYISHSARQLLEQGNLTPESPGELNYLITTICLKYMRRHKSYALINDVVGALECAKLEFYRRLAAPYEDTKITENGDVYPK